MVVSFKDSEFFRFYSENRINVSRILEFPSLELLENFSEFPNEVFPSDHLYLLAELIYWLFLRIFLFNKYFNFCNIHLI